MEKDIEQIELEKIQKRMSEIEDDRKRENEFVSTLSDEDKVKFLTEKYKMVADFAKKNNLKFFSEEKK